MIFGEHFLFNSISLSITCSRVKIVSLTIRGGEPTKFPIALRASKGGLVKKFPPVFVSRTNLYQLEMPT